MLALIASAVALASPVAAPVSLKVVRVDQRAPLNTLPESYDRVRATVRNDGNAPASFRLCPEDMQSRNVWIGGEGRHSSVNAFAVSADGRRAYRTRCQTLALQPGQERVVDYFVRGLPRDVRRQSREFLFTTNLGTFAWTLPPPVRRS